MIKDTRRKIGIATLIMMASIFLSRLMGVFRESAIAAIGGADMTVDAYKVAFVLPEILNHILASGFLSITFIPIFSRHLANGDESRGWYAFSNIMTVFGIFLAVLIALAMLITPTLVPLLAPGRDDPRFIALAVRMTRIILPAQLFFFIGGLVMAVQFAKEQFFIPALAPLIYNLGIILGGVLLGPWLGMEGFAWGVFGGALLGNCILQVISARTIGMRFIPVCDLKHPDLRRYLVMTLPLMVGLTMTFSTEIFSKFFGSFLPSGAIAWVDYAWRIVMMVVAFFGQAVGVAAYPYLARLAAENRFGEMNRLCNAALRYLSLVLPVSALVWVLRHEVVGLLFQRGHFTPHDTQMTSLALSGMLVGAVAFAAQTVVTRGFYALQNTITPAVFGSISVALSLPIYWVGVKTLGVLGIGLAISLSALLQVWIIYTIWSRRSNNVDRSSVYRFYAKIVLVTLPLAFVLELAHGIVSGYFDPSGVLGRLTSIGVTTLLFSIMAIAATRLLNIEEAAVLWSKIAHRLKIH
jgi:putative peptidoglycan lipid II flippase